MAGKIRTAQPPFRVLVAHFTGAKDAAGNPVKLRSYFDLQTFVDLPYRARASSEKQAGTLGAGSSVGYAASAAVGVSVAASGTVTVANNTFAGPTRLMLGDFVLTTGVEFQIGGTVNDTATNLAAAIDKLPGYSASATNEVVDVTGPVGLNGNTLLFKAGGASPQNLTLSPTTGSLTGAEPYQGPVDFGV